jgi:uncharacterized Zn finger protein (UPF0148 family)
MDCPECGTPLVTYRLGDREAPVCERCGHVGIDAEHRPARTRVESWSDALRRFYGTTDAGDADSDPTVPVRPADRDDPAPRARAETWTEALERFYAATDDRAAGSDDAPDRDPAQGADDRAAGSDDAPESPASVAFDGRSAVRGRGSDVVE